LNDPRLRCRKQRRIRSCRRRAAAGLWQSLRRGDSRSADTRNICGPAAYDPGSPIRPSSIFITILVVTNEQAFRLLTVRNVKRLLAAPAKEIIRRSPKLLFTFANGRRMNRHRHSHDITASKLGAHCPARHQFDGITIKDQAFSPIWLTCRSAGQQTPAAKHAIFAKGVSLVDPSRAASRHPLQI